MKHIIAITLLTLFCACSTTPCRAVRTDGVPESILKNDAQKNVLVYKYDGTKQCNQGLEISLDAMSRELRDIKIISMSKKNDGQLRMQVCGAQTGAANVYEISEKDFKKAKSYGFSLWTFN